MFLVVPSHGKDPWAVCELETVHHGERGRRGDPDDEQRGNDRNVHSDPFPEKGQSLDAKTGAAIGPRAVDRDSVFVDKQPLFTKERAFNAPLPGRPQQQQQQSLPVEAEALCIDS